jgi:adenosylmethionine-8-amino-7-oxononanoate aminotransferase
LNDPRRMFVKNMLPEQYHVKEPECRRNGCEREGKCVCGGLKELVSLLDSRAVKDVAGVIVEPIYQGGEGFRLYSSFFLRGVREACTKHDVVLVVDEISTGFGRLGVMWASELAGIMPDIITVGKSLTGGHAPLSAALVSERLARAMNWQTPNIRGPTYSACAVGCAATIATMELLKTTPWRIETIMKRKLIPFAEANQDIVTDVRILGATVAIEMKNACDAAIARKVKFRALRKWKCFVDPQENIIPLAPPFNAPLTDEEVERLVARYPLHHEILSTLTLQ